MSTPYDAAKSEGYTDQEIQDFLSKRPNQSAIAKSHDQKYQEALSEGHSKEEIDKYLSSKKPVTYRGARKAGRIAMQAGLGVAERALLPYEIAVAPLASKEAQQVPYRENVAQDIERLLELKSIGAFDESDQKLLDNLKEQLAHPEKSEQFIKISDLGVRGLVEKATGIETRPEGALEKAANWIGFIKKPSNAKELIKLGSSPKQIIKSIVPTGTEVTRGLGAGTALQMAEEGHLGPIGTLSAAVVGDLIGAGAKGAIKGIGKAISAPRQAAGKITGGISKLLTKNEKLDLQKQIIQDFRNAGIQADLGTITNNPLIQSLQARLAASGFTGKAFDNFKQQLTQDIQNQYKKIADTLGEGKFASTYEANELGKEVLSKIRDKDLAEIRELYKDARQLAKGKEAVFGTPKLATKIAELQADLSPGAVKSPATQKVLQELEKFKTDLYDEAGNLKPASIEALINNKINLNDIADFEVQGGTKKLLNGLIKDIDNALKEYGTSQDKDFLKKYISSNERFKSHAEAFRSENVNKILTSEDPSHLLKKMDNIQGIKDVKKAFEKSPEGKDLFKELARYKMDEILQKNMVDGATNQIKLGTFSNVLQKGNNRDIIRELLDPEAYKQLVNLQKNTGKLYDSAQKFYNASKSGTVVIEASLLNKVANLPLAVAGALSGNVHLMAPYLTIGGLSAITHLMTNAKFLRAIEDAILASEKNSPKLMQKAADVLIPYAAQITPAAASSERGFLEEGL